LRSIGSHDVFELRAAKRGGRLGWLERDGKKSYIRHLAHAKEPGAICWREVEIEATQGGRPRNLDSGEMFGLLPASGLSAGEWQRLAKTECGISESTFHRERRSLIKTGRVLKSILGTYQPVTKL
jgi:hypothetical protein